MVVQTPVMASLQVENMKKEIFWPENVLFSVQSAAQADPVQQTTEGYNYEVTNNFPIFFLFIHHTAPGTWGDPGGETRASNNSPPNHSSGSLRCSSQEGEAGKEDLSEEKEEARAESEERQEFETNRLRVEEKRGEQLLPKRHYLTSCPPVGLLKVYKWSDLQVPWPVNPTKKLVGPVFPILSLLAPLCIQGSAPCSQSIKRSKHDSGCICALLCSPLAPGVTICMEAWTCRSVGTECTTGCKGFCECVNFASRVM